MMSVTAALPIPAAVTHYHRTSVGNRDLGVGTDRRTKNFERSVRSTRKKLGVHQVGCNTTITGHTWRLKNMTMHQQVINKSFGKLIMEGTYIILELSQGW
jgi:hypothetical protein